MPGFIGAMVSLCSLQQVMSRLYSKKGLVSMYTRGISVEPIHNAKRNKIINLNSLKFQ